MARPRPAPPPPLLEFTSDDVLIKVFAHVPFFSHGTLRVVCRRAKTLLDSTAFRNEWRESLDGKMAGPSPRAGCCWAGGGGGSHR